MNIFKWLFRSTSKLEHQQRGAIDLTSDLTPSPTNRISTSPKLKRIGTTIISIPSIDFFGAYSISSSGEWIIGWRTGSDSSDNYGYLVLYNTFTDSLVHQEKLQRPANGAVANNGTFSIENWLSSETLVSELLIIKNTGERLIHRKFKANIFNSSISDNGLFAICQTANNKAGRDGNKLTAFNLKNQTELFSITPETQWAFSYTFNEAEQKFGITIRGVGEFWYDSAGNFFDTDAYASACLISDNFTDILLEAEKLIKEGVNVESAEGILKSIVKAREIGADKYPAWKAVALKLQGNVQLVMGNYKEALKSFDEALKIDPKIGVKRKADALRKKCSDHK